MSIADTRQEIQALIEEIDQTYWGPEERAMIDRALGLSQEIGDLELEYAVRLRLTASAARTGDNDTLITSFAWCLAHHDADPARFPSVYSEDLADLMWHFKWIIGTLDAAPIFSLERCAAVLDDMEAHYVKENLGLSGVIQARFQHAWATGQIDEARDWRDRLLTTPRDEHSHCDACGRSELAGFAVDTGDDALALKLVDEIMEGGFSCGEEPEHALSRTLIAKLRAGRFDDALESHMRSYRLARNNPDNISIVADNMVFCAVTGNAARGLAMVERHLPWLAHDSLNAAGQLNLLTAIGTVLDAVERADHHDVVVRGAGAPALEHFWAPDPSDPVVERSDPATPPSEPEEISLAEARRRDMRWPALFLKYAVWRAAGRLAAAFDQRNGNTYISEQMARTRALLDTPYDLPIATDVFAPPVKDPAAPQTPEQYLAVAEVHLYADVYPQALVAATYAAKRGDAAVRARAYQIAMWSHYAQDEPEAAAELFPLRLQALRDAGRTLQADVEERVGPAMVGADDAGAAQRLEAELQRLAAQPGEVLADVELTLAEKLLHDDEPDLDRIVSLVDAAIGHAATRPSLQGAALRLRWELYARGGDVEAAVPYADRTLQLELTPGHRAATLVARAHLMGALGRFEEGLANADAATAIYAATNSAELETLQATRLASALAHDAGRPEDEVARLRYALRLTEELEEPTTGTRYRLGRALTATGHPREAVEILWEVRREEAEAKAEPADRAETLIALAQAFEAADQYGSAVDMYERSADLLVEAGQPLPAADCLRRKGNIERLFEIYDQAQTTLAAAWDLAKDTDSYPVKVNVLEAWAFAKGAAGETAGLDDMDQAMDLVRADPEGPFPWKLADLTDSRARVLMDLDRRDEAVAAFLQAADGYAGAGDVQSAARAEHFAAQNLAGPLERPADAVPLWHDALAHADAALAEGTDASGLRDSILVKLAEALDTLGRAVEAASVRTQMTNPPE